LASLWFLLCSKLIEVGGKIMPELKYLLVVLAAILFWAFNRIVNPSKPKYAARDFLEQSHRTVHEDQIISKSMVHQLMYPLYLRFQQLKPLTKNRYEDLQQQLIKAGEYNSRPEDIQIAQLTNAVLYPLFFLVAGLFIGGGHESYGVVAGVFVGYYMYRAPLSSLKSKQKKQAERLLEEFTKFVTVYLMLVSGNATPDEALKKAISRTSERLKALSYYLNTLTSDMETKGTIKALHEFSEAMDKSYADRFTNNVQLAIKNAGSDQTTLNLRLRETLNEMAEQVIDEKINRLKVQARIPVFVSVGMIAIYMTVMLGASFMMMF